MISHLYGTQPNGNEPSAGRAVGPSHRYAGQGASSERSSPSGPLPGDEILIGRKRTFRILVVEDSEANLVLAQSVLEREGFLVDGAGSAEDARDVIRDKPPDLILMDIQLPGMDGLDFTRELKADPSTASIPVVALTAHAMPIYERAAQAAGCEGFITKPSSPAVLAAQVNAFLEGRGKQDN